MNFPFASNIRLLSAVALASLQLLVAPIAVADIFSAMLPAGRSVQVGATATAFVTIINSGTEAATSCSIIPSTLVPADFLYQTTNPATNELTGTADTPVTIPAQGSQSFVIALTPTSVISPTEVRFNMDCSNTEPAPVFEGLNTLLLSASSTPVPDVVALAATPTNDGIVGLSESGAFSVATVNVGSTASITASATYSGAGAPVAMSICQTNPSDGQCLAPPAPAATGVTTTIASNGTPTFSIFATALQDIPLDPANSRVFVRFTDGGGVVRGATSVAVLGETADNPACDVRIPISANQTINGSLTTSDCTVRELLGDPDDSYLDIYQLTVGSTTTLTLSMTSGAFNTYLAIANEALTTIIVQDNDGGSGTDALLSDVILLPGTYLILANSLNVETGSYTLTTSTPATPTDVLGSYSGNTTQTLTACDDSDDNGTYSFSTTVNINSQSGANYSGTLSGQANISGINLTLTGTIEGTVNDTGNLTGNLETTLRANGAFDSSSTASGTGTLVGNSFTFNFTGRDIAGDSCNFTGRFTGTR